MSLNSREHATLKSLNPREHATSKSHAPIVSHASIVFAQHRRIISIRKCMAQINTNRHSHCLTNKRDFQIPMIN